MSNDATEWMDMGVSLVFALGLLLWMLRAPYMKWKQRRRLRQLESEARRRWEQNRRE